MIRGIKKYLSNFIIILFFSLLFAAGTNQDNQKNSVHDDKHTISMGERLKSSGKTGILLLIVSIIGLSFTFERISNLRGDKIVPSGLVKKVKALWQGEQFDEIIHVSQKTQSTLGHIIELIVENRNLTSAAISNISGDLASREMNMHLHKSYPLAVIATISPLIGLFGTVYGMVGAFETVAIAGEMGNPAIMAESISYALMTTAIGLIIAVPALAAYHFFRTRTNIFTIKLEENVSDLISEWFIKKENGNAHKNK